MGTGRKPYVTHDVTPLGSPDQRLRPPDSLGPAEKRVFWSLITQTPASQFQPADLPLICRWCELTALADRAAAELSTASNLVENGLPSPWISIHERATKQLIALSLRLRLSPQSRMDKAPKTQAAATLSYYEQMALEGDDGDGDPDRDRP
jgi:phage terminase small subunit